MTANLSFIFETPVEELWQACFSASGFDAAAMSPHSGRA